MNSQSRRCLLGLAMLFLVAVFSQASEGRAMFARRSPSSRRDIVARLYALCDYNVDGRVSNNEKECLGRLASFFEIGK